MDNESFHRNETPSANKQCLPSLTLHLFLPWQEGCIPSSRLHQYHLSSRPIKTLEPVTFLWQRWDNTVELFICDNAIVVLYRYVLLLLCRKFEAEIKSFQYWRLYIVTRTQYCCKSIHGYVNVCEPVTGSVIVLFENRSGSWENNTNTLDSNVTNQILTISSENHVNCKGKFDG